MVIACYLRVSTEEQSLDRQREETFTYATDQLDAEPTDVQVFEDTGTGRDTSRRDFTRMMAAVEAGEINQVVVLELSRLSRSMRDLSTTLERLKEYNAGLHVVDRGLSLDPDSPDPMTEAFFYLAGVFAQLEADIIRERTISGVRAAKEAGKWTGRPPYGFTTDDDGYLMMNDKFPRAIAAVEELARGESVRSTAKTLGMARSTIRSVRDNWEFYDDHADDDLPNPTEQPRGNLEQRLSRLEGQVNADNPG